MRPSACVADAGHLRTEADGSGLSWKRGMVSRIDAHGEAIGGLARARQRVELGDEYGHPVPELPGLLRGYPGMADEAPERAVHKRPRGLASCNLEIVEVARHLAELFVYPGEQHLFADSSLDNYDPEAAALLMERVGAFLAAV